jgi:hypothetical protein
MLNQHGRGPVAAARSLGTDEIVQATSTESREAAAANMSTFQRVLPVDSATDHGGFAA